MTALLLGGTACQGGREEITVIVPPSEEAAFEDFVAFLPWDRRELKVSDRARPSGAGLEIGVVLDASCAECWWLEEVGREDWMVHAGDRLGAQYGVAEVLEGAGFRFHHPYASYAPPELLAPQIADPSVLRAPEVRRRGIHLQTLHPVEALFDVYSPSEDGEERSARILDWLIKNRGNHLDWFALDNLLDPAEGARWNAHTAPILARAHLRGVQVGIGLQLFGAANLQRGFDLLDQVGSPEEQRAVMRERLSIIFPPELPWDVAYVSFGEFFEASPEAFLESAQIMEEEIHRLAPKAEVVGKVHVGADLRVSYGGDEIIYYFLIEELEGVTPWVHTVMYYNLFDDAGGSYHHEDYSEHRELLLRRIAAGEAVAYYPESAYWVAFDISVPSYLPIYMKSRWQDFEGIHQAGVGALPEHVLFSSGWEWGYWQSDVSVLRMSFQRPSHWMDPLREQVAPHPSAAEVAEIIEDLGDEQYRLLLQQRLAPYMAGTDIIMDLGFRQGIVAQPPRLPFEDAAREEDPALSAGLASLAQAHAEAARRYEALSLDRSDPFLAEVEDGLSVNAARSSFIRSLYEAMFAHSRGEDPARWLTAADEALAAGQGAVQRRHSALHSPNPERLLSLGANPTIYPLGYLRQADTLCYWQRERTQARNLLLGEDIPIPGCIFD